MSAEKQRRQLTEEVKAAGEELIRRAEGLVGTENEIRDLDIILHFQPFSVPTITVRREHVNTEAIRVLAEWDD